LIENAKEAERQRKFLEKESGGLKHRLLSNHTDVERAARARLRENSNLLYECNDLRYDGCTTLVTITYTLSCFIAESTVHYRIVNTVNTPANITILHPLTINLYHRREVKQLERQLDVQGNEKQDMLRQLEGLRKQLMLGHYGQGGGRTYVCVYCHTYLLTHLYPTLSCPCPDP